MSLTQSTPKPPLWNKSMAKYLGNPSPAAEATGAGDPVAGNHADLLLNESTLVRLGLKVPPRDHRLLAEFLIAEDAADGAMDQDEFARGIRRAVRISLALSAQLHRRSGQPWKQWVAAQFKVGYACFHRYHVAAQLQVGLLARNLSPLTNEYQSRALAPYRRHEKFWDVLATFKDRLPAAQELKDQLPALLGTSSAQAAITSRVKLHRVLSWVVRTNGEGEDPLVQRALGLVRQAVALLEKGTA